MKVKEDYKGFEVGPIRPPSEGDSLLLRLTRNCSWNKCTFCGLYKGEKFSIRSIEHVFEDIENLKLWIDALSEENKEANNLAELKRVESLKKTAGIHNEWAYYSATQWLKTGMKSIFLQDANTMIMKPDDLVDILQRVRDYFPNVERVTSYARSHTINNISDEDLKRIADAGLNRIHIGMESANDDVLKIVKKGVDKKTHILAGQKVKRAGIELSEYYMPGLGGQEYSEGNALDTADALNQINPDFIRIRTLALPDDILLVEDYRNGTFTRTNDAMMAKELQTMIKNLEGIDSYVKSDHILNLIEEVEGRLAQDKDKMVNALQWYLDLSREDQIIFSVGRRSGVMKSIKDFNDPHRKERVLNTMAQFNINESNADQTIDELMKRFI
ncbi:radical SAM protein [Marinifilum sp. D714]|uniref:radical SAM protein n=1 Tax=Marinifilum sp. D714 TaxID=2937523 RepID=UPI0027CFFDEC|nr:radical SAM protein [Marinifilum sp. D714]MDQ2177883.1 radical SAM protein [Marinifilum sp. D714]